MDNIITYLVIINAVSFLLMLIDKEKAKRHKWRIPEIVLLGTCALGGSFGTLMSMYIYRHKTMHVSFTAGVPFMLFLHFFVLLWLFGIKVTPPA